MHKETSFRASTLSASFTPRHGHRSLVFRNKMWVIGGDFKSDVWWSEDGVSWTQADVDNDFKTYFGHSVVSFQGKMWIIGGHGAMTRSELDPLGHYSQTSPVFQYSS